MIVEKKPVFHIYVHPGETFSRSTPQLGTVEVTGHEDGMEVSRPGAAQDTGMKYFDGQTLTMHEEGSDFVFHPSAGRKLPHGETDMKKTWTETHILLPGEIERVTSPEPMTIIGGAGHFAVRYENPGTQGPDIIYTTQFTTFPKELNGNMVIFEPFHPQQFQESAVLDAG